MFHAKYRKVLWMALTVHLLLAHFWGINRFWNKVLLVLGTRVPMLFLVRIYPLWIAGFVLTGLWQFGSYEKFRRRVLRGAEPIEESWIRGIHLEAAKEAGLGVPLPLYRSSFVETPMVIGFSSQILLLPEESYTSPSLRIIFLHEYIHVKRGDLWYKLFFSAGACILWFQPLMYLLKWAAFRDVEIACDQKVVRGKGEADRNAYGQLLIDSLRKRSRELPYSAYFYNSKTVMKARLAVVMDEREHLGYLGALLCLLVAVETGALVLTAGVYTARQIYSDREESTINIYDGYALPESFSEGAVEAMVQIVEQSTLSSGMQLLATQTMVEEIKQGILVGEQLEEEAPSVTVKKRQAKGPWQIENPYQYWRVVPDFLYRYLMYYGDQEVGSRREPELPEHFAGLITPEIQNYTLIATNMEAYICAVRFRVLVIDERDEPLRSLPGAQTGYDQGYEYLYFNWALHIRINEENIYELVGVAKLCDALKACEGKDLDPQFEEFIELDLWQRPMCRARTLNGVTEATWDNGKTWVEVPVALEKLTARGDQLDGALNGIQEKSYVVSEDMTAFAYGGSPEVPVTVTCSPDQGITWNTSVITYEFLDVRRLFLSFPDKEHGFLVVTSGRAMRQEGKNIFCTLDGGKTWKEITYLVTPTYNVSHSLLTGAEFITPKVGFFTTQSSGDPVLYRTDDGGKSWELQMLPDIPKEAAKEYGEREPSFQGEMWETYMAVIGFTNAYPPSWDGQVLYLYLTQEEYSELGGEKARYRSEDLGETWSFDGFVLRK